jgi:hypothetical protein
MLLSDIITQERKFDKSIFFVSETTSIIWLVKRSQEREQRGGISASFINHLLSFFQRLSLKGQDYTTSDYV